MNASLPARIFKEGRGLPAGLAIVLLAAVFVLYRPVSGFGFIGLDDHGYTVNNESVRNGITVSGLREIFTTLQQDSYIPLTWLSYMADVEIRGLGAGGFHRTNALLHLLNSLLLFLFLYRAALSPVKAFFASSLWALHPLRIESVAWVAERKDVLSGFLFLACLLFYLEYAKKQKTGWYLLALLSFIAGLLSKPMIVVTPLILLIVDFWPLGRFGECKKRLLIEKTPFFALSLAVAVLTFYAGKDGFPALGKYPFAERLSEVATSLSHYLGETVWPVGLILENTATSKHLTGFAALAAFGGLAVATALAFRLRESAPAVLAGWLWYVCALLPVSGVVGMGTYSVADHFTYLPGMGLSFLAVWGVDHAVGRREEARKTLCLAGAVILVLLAGASRAHLPRWKDGIALFNYHVESNESAFSYKSLATEYAIRDDRDTALKLLKKAVEISPGYTEAHRKIATLLTLEGRREEAMAALERAVRTEPGMEQNYLDMMTVSGETGDESLILYSRGRYLGFLREDEKAVESLRAALALAPENPLFTRELGAALARAGKSGEAAPYFEKALALAPDDSDANFYLGLSLFRAGETARSGQLLSKAVELDPNNFAARYNYGLWLEASGKRTEAAIQYREVLRIISGNEEAEEGLERTGG